MEYYEKMRTMGCFTWQDLMTIAGTQASAVALIHDYQRKGYIERIHRNLYAVIDKATKQPVLNRYQIGSILYPDACISHRSAFEVLGCAGRALEEVYVATESRFTDFKYNGVFYRRVIRKADISTQWVERTRITSLEQTVVDSIRNFEKIAGLEEVIRCIMQAPKLDEGELLKCLDRYGNGYLYQKCGYVLEQLQEYVNLSDTFYMECKMHCPTTIRYLLKNTDELVYQKGWGIYAPVSIREFVDMES